MSPANAVLRLILIGTAIKRIARLIYQRWNMESHPKSVIKAVAEPTPAKHEMTTPTWA